jgi:hypothetical protein
MRRGRIRTGIELDKKLLQWFGHAKKLTEQEYQERHYKQILKKRNLWDDAEYDG